MQWYVVGQALHRAGSSEEHMSIDEMFRKQRTNFKAFDHSFKAILRENFTEPWQFQNADQTIQRRWDAIDCLYWEIDRKLYGDEENDFWYGEYEQKYLNIIESLNNRMWSPSHREYLASLFQDFHVSENRFSSMETSKLKLDTEQQAQQPESSTTDLNNQIFSSNNHNTLLHEAFVTQDSLTPCNEELNLQTQQTSNTHVSHVATSEKSLSIDQAIIPKYDYSNESGAISDISSVEERQNSIKLLDTSYHQQAQLPSQQEVEEKLVQSKSIESVQFDQLTHKLNQENIIIQSQSITIKSMDIDHMHLTTSSVNEPSNSTPRHCLQYADSTNLPPQVDFNALNTISSSLSLNIRTYNQSNVQQGFISLRYHLNTFSTKKQNPIKQAHPSVQIPKSRNKRLDCQFITLILRRTDSSWKEAINFKHHVLSFHDRNLPPGPCGKWRAEVTPPTQPPQPQSRRTTSHQCHSVIDQCGSVSVQCPSDPGYAKVKHPDTFNFSVVE